MFLLLCLPKLVDGFHDRVEPAKGKHNSLLLLSFPKLVDGVHNRVEIARGETWQFAPTAQVTLAG